MHIVVDGAPEVLRPVCEMLVMLRHDVQLRPGEFVLQFLPAKPSNILIGKQIRSEVDIWNHQS